MRILWLIFFGLMACDVAPAEGLSEAEILRLYRSGSSEADLTGRLQRDGLSFEMDSSVLQRLGEAGIPRTVLESMLDARVNIAEDADDMIRRGHLDAAAKALSAVLQRNPRDYTSRYKLILLYIKSNRSMDAAAEYSVLKRTQDDQSAREMVREIETLLPEISADPEKETALRAELRTALEQYRTADAYAIVDRMQIGDRNRDVLKTYLDLYQANFPGAFVRAAKVSSAGNSDDRNAGQSLRTEIERSFKKYQEVTKTLEGFLFSQLAVGSCTPVTARTAVGASNFSLQQYAQMVIDANRTFPLDPRMQDLRFHAVLISTPSYEDVARVGNEILKAKGSLRIPFFSRDSLFWLVLDQRKQRIYTELNVRMPRNGFSSPDLSPMVPFDLSFTAVKGLRQRIVADHALYGIARDSYALQVLPRGEAPNYTFMNLIHCLYGEQVQRTVSRNLADFVLEAIGNPSMQTAFVDPGKKSRDWVMTGAQQLAYGSIAIAMAVPVIVAVHPAKPSVDGTNTNTSNTSNTLGAVNMSMQVVQESLNVLMAHALELVRASEILGRADENISMFGILRGRAFPLVDPAIPREHFKRVDALLSLAVH